MSEATPIQIQVESVGTCTTRVVIQLSEELVQQEMRAIAREISRERTIPGFRKGKAPYAAVARLYGEDLLREEVAERLSTEFLANIVREHGIRVFGSPYLEEKSLRPMRFVYTLYQPPTVRLGDYSSLRIEEPPVEVTEEDLNARLEALRQEAAVLEPVEGRGARPGDVLSISVEERDEEGRLLRRHRSIEITLTPESRLPAPGFHQALEGMTPGETRTFRLPLPQEDGREREFRVTLEALYRRILPDVDDDLARTVGNFRSLEELKDYLRQRIREEKEQAAREQYASQALDRLVEQSEVEYPPIMLEEEVNRWIEKLAEEIRRQYRLSLEDYLKISGQTMEEVREQAIPRADRSLRRMLVLGALVKAEGLEVTEEEIDRAIQSLSEDWGEQAEGVRRMYQDPEARERLSDQLLYNKVMGRLVAIARGEYSPEGQAEAKDANP